MNSLILITAMAMTTGHGGKACGGGKMMKHHKARATCVAAQAPTTCGTTMAYASPTMAPAPAPMIGGSPQMMSPASPQAVPMAPPVPMATPGGAPPAPPAPPAPGM